MPQHHFHAQSSTDNRIFVGFLILIVWLPLPDASNQVWAWAIMEIAIFTLMLLWLWKYLFYHVQLTPVFYQATPVLIIWCLWLIYITWQWLPIPYSWLKIFSPQAANWHTLSLPENSLPSTASLSVDPHATLVAWLQSVSYFVLFILTLLLIHRRTRLRQLAYTLVFSGLFQAIYGSLMTLSKLEWGFFQSKVFGIGVATGTFVNRNHLAGYLEMCLAIGIGLLIAQLGQTTESTWRQRLRSLLSWLLSGKMRLRLALVIMVIALVLTRSRMGNVAFFSSLLIAGTIGLLLSRHATRSTVILLTSLIVIDLVIVGTWFGIDEVAYRLQQTTLITEVRDEVDINLLPYWRDYIWTGSGLGTFFAVFPNYQEHNVEGYFDHAHNDYLEFGAETGIIGLLLVGSIVILSLSVALLAQYRRHDPLCRGIAFSTTMAIIALLVHSSVDFNLQIPANAATFVIILALAWISSYLSRKMSSM
ncbi:MAG: hypothetical protein BWK79_13685 [Beggiatoa sp. IS2]|nr:MAG: hypothetical protein BWK79_13685 [Beggiatoa sp. IS2]